MSEAPTETERLPALFFERFRCRVDPQNDSIYVEHAHPRRDGEGSWRPHVSIHFGRDELVVHFRAKQRGDPHVYFRCSFEALRGIFEVAEENVRSVLMAAMERPGWYEVDMDQRARSGWRYVPIRNGDAPPERSTQFVSGLLGHRADLDGRTPARQLEIKRIEEELVGAAETFLKELSVSPRAAVTVGILVHPTQGQVEYCFTHEGRSFAVPDWPDRVFWILEQLAADAWSHSEARPLVDAVVGFLPWFFTHMGSPVDVRRARRHARKAREWLDGRAVARRQ